MAYDHSIRQIGRDHFRLSWVIDRKYAGSRLRFPMGFSRDTDTAGARRFAKKWRLDGWLAELEPPVEALRLLRLGIIQMLDRVNGYQLQPFSNEALRFARIRFAQVNALIARRLGNA